MRSKLFKAIGGLLLGVAPIVFLALRFGVAAGEETVETGATLPIIPLILIIVLSVTIIFWVYSQFMNTLKKHPFSNVSLLFYGGVGTVIAFYIMLVLSSVTTGVEESVEEFLTNMEMYIMAVRYVLSMQVVGAFVLVVNVFLDLGKSLK